MALAPFPMTATRRPARSQLWSQRRRVPHRTAERIQSLQTGDVRSVELATGEHDGIRFENRRPGDRGQGQSPPPGGLVEGGVLHGGPEPEVGSEPVAAHALLGVGQDLGLFGEPPGPVGLRGEGERVEVRGHITAASRVGVVPPGATDTVGLLDDGEVPHSRPNELDGQSQAGQTGSHDHDRGDRVAVAAGGEDRSLQLSAPDVQSHARPPAHTDGPRPSGVRLTRVTPIVAVRVGGVPLCDGRRMRRGKEPVLRGRVVVTRLVR